MDGLKLGEVAGAWTILCLLYPVFHKPVQIFHRSILSHGEECWG
jgi:hypothetical protein